MPEPKFSYEQALKSFDSLASNTGCHGGRKLLRRVLAIGLAEGKEGDEIAQNIADRMGVSRDEVITALANCYSRQSHPGQASNVVRLVQTTDQSGLSSPKRILPSQSDRKPMSVCKLAVLGQKF